MCNAFASHLNASDLARAFIEADCPISQPQAWPNLEPVDEIRPTDPAWAVTAAPGGGARLTQMRFGFPPPRPRAGPIINFRSERRRLSNGAGGGRALIPVSAFYEFTGDRYPKTRWAFSSADDPFLALAAVWRVGGPGAPDAFSLLTAAPGPDVAPYHDRGVLPLPSSLWADWLFDRRPGEDILKAPGAGALSVTAAPRPERR